LTVIGKGGEQITSIQADSECRVQFAQGITSTLMLSSITLFT